MAEILTVIILGLLLALREYLSYRERSDMLDRLMAKNLPEYKDNATVEENQYDSPDLGLAELEEARKDIEDGPEIQ